ncbi:PIG-L family deacetylase [Tessaracoccus coleopterorum]|uniref:PIG-L family deacetylase n=1 Tax=Tessaracoccus coleopterorum TaxID=2714950 RepID=UPI002F90DC3B
MPTDRRLLLVHAHPDDESSQSAATMARYLAEGAQVTLVTCTLGELGEILVPEWAHYTPAELGRHRVGEIGRPWASSASPTTSSWAGRALPRLRDGVRRPWPCRGPGERAGQRLLARRPARGRRPPRRGHP